MTTNMKTATVTKKTNNDDTTQGRTNRSQASRPRMLTVNQGVSSRLIDSVRAALENIEEPEKKKNRVDPEDPLGEQIAYLLNQSPQFQRQPLHLGCNRNSPEDKDNDNESSNRPLLSSRNLKQLKQHLGWIKDDFMSAPKEKLSIALRRVWAFLFQNSKSVSGGLFLFFGLEFMSLSCSAAAITFASLWSLRITWIISFFALSMLVDLKELDRALPEALRKMFAKTHEAVIWFDKTVLQGKRYQGREWNKTDFEWNDAKSAQSSQKYLWDLSPPSLHEGKRLCVDEKYMSREEWSTHTTKHVVAIDFCYVMLREAFLLKQFSKLRKAATAKSDTVLNPVVSTTESNGETITYTRKPSHFTSDPMNCSPEASIVDRQREIDVSASSKDERELKTVRSPTDAIEVVRQLEPFSHDQSKPLIQNRDDEALREDTGFSRLDHILEEDSSDDTSIAEYINGSVSTNSDTTTDMNWMDVGAEIGIKLLGSAAVAKAMASQDTHERINTFKEKLNPTGAVSSGANDPSLTTKKAPRRSPNDMQKKQIALPVHSMWTSASAAAASTISPIATVDVDSPSEKSLPLRDLPIYEDSAVSSQSPPRIKRLTYDTDAIENETDSSSDMELPYLPKIDAVHKEDHSIGLGATKNKKNAPPSKGLRRFSPLRSPRKKLSLQRPSREDSIEVVQNKKNLLISPAQSNLTTPSETNVIKRPLLLPGVKIAVPIFPLQPGSKRSKGLLNSHFQMATVVSSKRIFVPTNNGLLSPGRRDTNCLSITVKLDASFLRNGEFAELTLRVMDEWSSRYMPKHSKLPLGSCVSTTFGLGVLVGWRVEDDCHVVRSLWQRRGPGSACAYLRRDSIHCTVEAAVGFEVETVLGLGEVQGYIGAGQDFRTGRFLVSIKEEGIHRGRTLELNRADVLSCWSAQFIPVIEHIREAAQYQLQVDNYREALEEATQTESEDTLEDDKTWRYLSKYSDILWKSFLRATEEDDDFDEGMNEFITSMVNFLDRLDSPTGMIDSKGNEDTNIIITATDSTHSSKHHDEKQESGFNRFMNDVFGIFGTQRGDQDEDTQSESIEVQCTPDRYEEKHPFKKSYDRAFAVIRTLMRTVSIARAQCVDEPNFKLALSVCYELLLFVKTVVKVQQKNISPHSLKVWRRAWEEIISTFGPVKDRLEKIGQGVAERMEKQGRRAKVRLLRFVDRIVQDDILLAAIEHGDWDRSGEQIELAMVKAKIIDEESRDYFHRTAQFIYNHFKAASSRNRHAAARNNEKLATLAMTVKLIAAPRRSILKLFLDVGVLDVFERVLVRVFHKEDVASRMLSIHASNFHTLRRFRMLKDFTIAGKMWIPLLDAADAEFSYMVSRMPENAKDLMCPLSSLFSLCTLQFHKISDGDLTKDWLDFMLEDEAVSIIHDIDMKLILALESFSRDIKEMMVVLPYYPSIEDDILNLVDEVDIHEFVKEASEAIEDAGKLSEFIREKSTIAIERFLDYLPKMSIPVEKRDLADGWVLTCRGADGGDLKLTDLTIKRENLTCQVLGGDTLFFPMLGGEADDVVDCKSTTSVTSSGAEHVHPISKPVIEESPVLDHIREMILQAQRHGCWQVGIGGLEHPPTDRYVSSILCGLPVTAVFNCAIELWRSLEIDDDELLEIAIRDVSFQIQLQKEREEASGDVKECKEDSQPTRFEDSPREPKLQRMYSHSSDSFRQRFNPRVDPTVLYLEINKLTFHLDNFLFRIEKHESRRTIFDPVFEGSGSLMVRNVSIKIRVECVKEYRRKNGSRVPVPLLQLRELDIQLEKVKLKVKNTGADWLLNKVVKGFEDNITQIMATNLIDQLKEQLNLALENLNGYSEVNPDLLLGFFGIAMDDLDEKVVFV